MNEPAALPYAYDTDAARRSAVPCWVEIEGVSFLHDPERPDRLDAFQGHEWAESPCNQEYPR